jgi:hypothetical protein
MMAIKQFIFSFKIEAKDLFEYIAERNVAVNIDAYGTAPKAKKQQEQLEAPPSMLALPAPVAGGKSKGRVPMKAVILAFLAANKKGAPSAALKELIAHNGHSKTSYNGVIWVLQQEGMVKRMANGNWRATAKAIQKVEVL